MMKIPYKDNLLQLLFKPIGKDIIEIVVPPKIKN